MYGELILGGAQLASKYGILNKTQKTIEIEQAAELIKIAKEKQFTAIDIAEEYGDIIFYINNINLNLDIHSKLNISSSKLLDRSLNLHSNINNLKILYIHNADNCNFNSKNTFNNLMRVMSYCRSKDLKFGLSLYDIVTLDNFLKHDIKPDIVQYPKNVICIRNSIDKLCKKENIKTVCRSIFLQGLLLAETQNTIPKKFSEHVALRNFNIWCQKNSLSKREVCLFDISIKNENKVLGFENKSQIQSFNRFSCEKREIKYPDFLKTSDLTLLDPRNW